MFRFVCDRIVAGRAYPALAQHSAEPYTTQWTEFADHWPYTVPCELIEHCDAAGVAYTLNTVENSEPGDLYIISLGWFDFAIDYFDLIPQEVFDRGLQIVFYYHEGDHPHKIQIRLEQLLQQHQLPQQLYFFISGNSAADALENFAYFADHELLYWRRNRTVAPVTVHTRKRTRDFTCLSRTHKWWRATAIADLRRNGLLDNSYWSYRTDIALTETCADNPIVAADLNIEYYLDKFLSAVPYTCDSLTAADHNDHAQVVEEHYTNSYCNIVLETLYDADGSGGTFLSEKTFKPIKHGQPFVVVAPAGTLQVLRDLGYRTFDSAIDNRYDLETDNTRRWCAAFRAIAAIKSGDLQQWFQLCQADVLHNQQLFAATKRSRLNNLYDKLLHKLAAPRRSRSGPGLHS